jgi:hypothetical protein
MHLSRMAIALLSIAFLALHATAQAPPFGGNLDVTRSRIGDERVQRQSEVSRLEDLLESFEARLIRMERQQLRASQLPAITVAESEATLAFAKAQLKESEYRLQRGDATEAQVAYDRLALVRAQGQLDAATYAHQETMLMLQMDVVYAERQLLSVRAEREVTERLAAKGHVSSKALQALILNDSLAAKELQLAKLRLQIHEKAGEKRPPAAPEPMPSSELDPDAAAPEPNTAAPEPNAAVSNGTTER